MTTSVYPALHERSIIFPNISWQAYKQILRDSEDTNIHRFYYDQGKLGIVTPSQIHEVSKSALNSLVERIVVKVVDGISETSVRQRSRMSR